MHIHACCACEITNFLGDSIMFFGSGGWAIAPFCYSLEILNFATCYIFFFHHPIINFTGVDYGNTYDCQFVKHYLSVDL